MTPPGDRAAPAVTIAYTTHRAEPRFDWFIDGVAAQADPNAVEVLFVDGLWSAARSARIAELVAGRFPFSHVPPKPNPWNGPARLTGEELWAAASARNTAIVYARSPYLVFVDDCSVLGPRWWEQVHEAAREGWVIAGAYQKHHEMRVRDGTLVGSRAQQSGVDTRWGLASGDEVVTIVGGQLYGNFAAPRELLVSVNGFDELCDPIGTEDYHLGIRLEWSGATIYYSRRMLTIESEELHDATPARRWGGEPMTTEAYMAQLAAFGVEHRTTEGPCDAARMLLDVLYGTRAVRSLGNCYDLRELTEARLHELPARFPKRYWFADIAIADVRTTAPELPAIAAAPSEDEAGLVYHPVRVAGRPPVQFCFDPDAGDPVARWMLANGWIDEPVMRAFLSFVTPHSRVIDLGAHLGTFSLPAARLGAQVISVDASPRHAALLRRAAQRNSLHQLHVVHGAVSDGDTPVSIVGRSIHTRVAVPDEAGDAPLRDVPAVSIDALLHAEGWEGVDLVKIDIEGSEPAALSGMRELIASGCRPVIVLECNGGLLPLFGSSPAALRQTLEGLGYRLFQIDHLQPGTLVPTSAAAIQTECVIDLLALPPRASIPPEWEVAPPFSVEQIVTRVIDHAASDGDGYRRYAAQTIAEAPEWLARHPLCEPATRALRFDLNAEVQGAIDAEGPRRHSRPPAAGGAPADTALFIEQLTLDRRSSEPDRPIGAQPPPEDILLGDFALHARAGELLGVLGDDPLISSELLRAIAGRRRPLGGHVHTPGRVVLIADVARVLEPELSVRENAVLYGAFLGFDARVASRDVEGLLPYAGLSGVGARPLEQCSVDAVLRLVLAVALQWGEPSLLLVDRLPASADAAFRSWASARTAQLRQSGATVVQVVTDPSLLLGTPSRLLWLIEGRIAACGYPAAVADAHDRVALELWSAA